MYHEQTKILSFRDGIEQYVPISTLRKGDLIRTTRGDGYVPIYQIGYQTIINPANTFRIKERLYIKEDIIITGESTILVTGLSDKEYDAIIAEYQSRMITKPYFCLPVHLDEQAQPYPIGGSYTVWNMVLENCDEDDTYGIYAGGILVDTLSLRDIQEQTILTLV